MWESFDTACLINSSTVPDISPPSICETKILLNEPTIAPANASILSPCTIIISGEIFFTYSEKPITVFAKIISCKIVLV